MQLIFGTSGSSLCQNKVKIYLRFIYHPEFQTLATGDHFNIFGFLKRSYIDRICIRCTLEFDLRLDLVLHYLNHHVLNRCCQSEIHVDSAG